MNTIAKRFEAKFIPEPNSGCWLWTAATWGNNGYGCFWDGERNQQAHIVAWKLYRGEVPENKNGLHKCDVPTCVNPDHIFWGTQKDNMDDAYGKGRRLNSLANLNPPKLNKSAVENIRNSQESSFLLQQRYGVSQALISMVKSGKRGKCLPD